MKKLVLFDLDGTILNTIKDLASAVNYGLTKNGLEPISVEMVQSYIGNGIAQLCHLASNGVNEESVLADFKSYYATHNHDESFVYKNIPTLLLRLKERYMLGILSNKKDEAVKVLNDYYFKDIFTFAWGEQDGVKRKPDSEALELIKSKYNLKSEDIIYIGDSEVDIAFSVNSKIDYIIGTWGFRSKEELSKLNPMTMVDDPLDILKLL